MSEIVSRKLELINEYIHGYQTELYSLTSDMKEGSEKTPTRPAGITEMIFITDKSESTPEARDEDKPISEDSHCFVVGGKIWLVQFSGGQILDVAVSYTDNWLVQAILGEGNVQNLVKRTVRLDDATDVVIHTLKAGMATRLEYKSTKIGRLIGRINSGLFEAPIMNSTEQAFKDAGGVITDKILALEWLKE
jgi:hypothetical protein